jgi:hypothetical protein
MQKQWSGSPLGDEAVPEEFRSYLNEQPGVVVEDDLPNSVYPRPFEMKRFIAIAFVFGLVGSLSFAPSPVSAQADGWTQLFDGKTLKGWNTVGNANWQVVDGLIQATAGMVIW